MSLQQVRPPPFGDIQIVKIIVSFVALNDSA